MLQLFHKNSYLRAIFFIWICLLPISVHAQNVALSVIDTAEGVELMLTLPAGANAKTFSLDGPPRVVVDIPNAGSKPSANLPNDGGGLIRTLRTGQYNAHTGRIVFELSHAFKMTSRQQANQLSILVSPHGKEVAKAHTNINQAPPPPKPEKKVIVLDAGHGGQDPGALGKGGTKEKHLVLKFTKELKDELERTGKYKVVLTRDGDYYIALRERLAFARKHKADIFISLHADSASSAARGLSVYTLSENASDDEAAALAKRENKSDIIAGVDLGNHEKDVADILISLAQRETNNQSIILADTLVASLENQSVNLLTRPHRYAGFAVLKAPDIPSVLVEIGFLSNREEEKALNQSSHRKKLAQGLTKAITHYFETTSKAFE